MDFVLFVEGVNRKKTGAWEQLYASYYSSLCSYTNRLIGDGGIAEDIVQEVLVAIWRSQKKFADARDLTLYLYRACYNNSLIYIRNQNIRRSHILKIAAEIPEDPDAHFAVTVQEELIRKLYIHIDELPAGSREIMKLSVCGMSGPEIAHQLGVSINTVKTQKSRGFKFLREKLKDSVLIFLL